MDRDRILEFVNANPACRLATVDGDQPRVRGMWMYRADGDGIVFHTGEPKDLCRQLRANPKVEVCFNNADSSVQVRVAGTCEFVTDPALRAEIVEARPFLKSIIAAQGEGVLAVFRVTGCRATAWTMATNLAPKTYVDL